MSADPEQLLSIGQLSRASGLSVSALRFYDRAGVLTPACVDDWSGYRRYSPGQVAQAQLIAGLRRVQMPVAEMATALEALRAGDRAAVADLLTGHLRRLEDGLADARRELERLLGRLGETGETLGHAAGARAQIGAASLLARLAVVRHAVGTDPTFPALQGVLVEVGTEVGTDVGAAVGATPEGGVTVVATDRYRLAVAGPSAIHRSPAAVLLPVEAVDDLVDWLRRGDDGGPGDAPLVLEVASGALVVRRGRESLTLAGLPDPYPDYRRVLEHEHETVELPAAQVEAALGSEQEVVDLGGVLVDRGYLWDAVRSVPEGQVLLPVGGVIAPLVVRSPEDGPIALVMPVAEGPR